MSLQGGFQVFLNPQLLGMKAFSQILYSHSADIMLLLFVKVLRLHKGPRMRSERMGRQGPSPHR